MPKVYAIDGIVPVVHPDAFVHPSAQLIGDVIVGAGVYVGPCACLRGDFTAALRLQDKLAPLHINLFVETSPAPMLISPPNAADRAPSRPAATAATAVSTAVAMSCHRKTVRIGLLR